VSRTLQSLHVEPTSKAEDACWRNLSSNYS
jgi:hypothetical protein